MRKFLLFACFLLFITPQYINAQESIGYSDSTDFQYLIEYRLPDWGYSNFSINSASFNSSGDYLNRDQDFNNSGFSNNSELSRSNYKTRLGISPRYELYKENEFRTFSLDMLSSISTDFSKLEGEEKSGGVTDEDNGNSNSQNFHYQILVNNDFYISNNTFLTTNLFSDITYTRSENELKSNNQVIERMTSKGRTVNLEPEIGVGFGRIRNVTPVIRSIRLNERYKVLKNDSFTDREILNTAEAFTKVQGYQRTHDRFQKYFWDDVNSGVNNKLDQASAYDLFYLNDVFSENLGNRLEGYEASINIKYLYYNQLRKEDNFIAPDGRHLSIYREAEINLKFDWYKNLNLYHQISFNVLNKLAFPLEREDDRDWINTANINAEWLWIFADRFQLSTSFLNSFAETNTKEEFDDINRIYYSRLGTNLFYFIENKLVLNAGVSLTYQNSLYETETADLNSKAFQWRIGGGIRYYFNRNLY